MRVINKTPHEIIVIKQGGNVIFPIEGQPARVESKTVIVESIQCEQGAVPVVDVTFSGVTQNLPEKQVGTIYIVSMITCQANPDRSDLYVVGDTVRDTSGRIIGTRALARNPYYKSK